MFCDGESAEAACRPAGLGWALGWAGVMLTDVISRAVAGAGSYFPRVQTFKIANLHTNNQQLSEPQCIFSCIRD